MRRFSFILAVVFVLLAVTASVQAETFDFGGQTVYIAGHGGPRDGEFKEGGRAPGLVEQAEELFNCKIEFIGWPFMEYADALMTRLLAGDSANDLWIMQQRQYWVLLPQSAFYPVSQVLSPDYFANLPEFPRRVIESLEYKGEYYAFGNHYGSVHPLHVLVYNKSLFEREALPDLYDLYLDGEWTWDKLTEIAKLATKDTNGDGEINQWGLANATGGNRLAIKMALANDGAMTRMDESGNAVFSFGEENAVAAMSQVYNWQAVDRILGGNAQTFIDGNAAMLTIGMYMLGGFINPNMEDDYAVVPYPRGPHATSHRYPAEALETWVLPANAENPEALVALYHFLWPAEGYEEGLENLFMSYVRDRNSYRVLMEAHDNFEGEAFHFDFVLGPTWTATPLMQAIGSAVNGSMSPIAAMEGVRAEVQAKIDDLFK